MSHFVDDSPPPLGEPQSSNPEQERPQSAGEAHSCDVRQVHITAIRMSNPTLGLRRIPAGFYVKVQVDDIQWQTTNKAVHVDQDVIEWKERIDLPWETSCKVRFDIYSSCELGPMLGHGGLLRAFEISIADLLDCSDNSRPIDFQPKAEEIVSPCTSLSITAEQSSYCETDVGVLCSVTPSASHDICTLILVTDAGHRTLARYHRMHEIKDLDQSIKYFERSRDLCPVNHPCHPAALFNLATAKFINCHVDGTCFDLDIPISLFQEALDLRPTGHPDRPATQLYLAISLLSRFTKCSFQTDADAAEELLNEVLDVCHPKSHIYHSALLAIETYVLRPAGSTDANDRRAVGLITSMLPLSLKELAHRLELCLRNDDPYALDEVISLHYEALNYYGAHYERGELLCNLGVALEIHFERRGIDEDLDQAIVLQTEALDLHPVGHSNRPTLLNNLANVLSTRFQYRGNNKDLDEAIVLHTEALNLRPIGHPDRSKSLNNLAGVLSSRFERRGNGDDLDETIALYAEALDLLPIGHSTRSILLDNLAAALLTCFKHRANDKDLDKAIVLHTEALDLRPVGHPDRSTSLNNLGNALSTCFEHRGAEKHLDEAIVLHTEALDLHPVGHPDRSTSLNNFAFVLSTRFQHRGNDKDLNDAIMFHTEALDLQPFGHPGRPTSLSSLASMFSTRFKHQGNEEDLDEAIVLHTEALDLHPVGHPDRSASLNNFAVVLSTSFTHLGNEKDLSDAIMLYTEALDLCPVGHPSRSESLGNLAAALLICFEHKGSDRDLDQAIMLHREAVDLRPVGHSDRSASLDGLATALYTRFRRRDNDEDLNEVIMLHREALDLWPASHPDRPSSLNNLAAALFTCFKDSNQGNNRDLDEAIVLYGEALQLYPVGHSDRPRSLNNLAVALFNRFQCRGDGKDIDKAMALHRAALDLRPAGHPDRPGSLINIAILLVERFEKQGNDHDLDEALVNACSALPLLTTHNPHQSIVHGLEAKIHLHFHQLGLHPSGKDIDNLNAVMVHLKACTDLVCSGLLSRLRMGLRWIHFANQYMHSTLLEAYTTSIQLLDAYMSVTASMSSRHDTMKLFPTTLAVDAASCALQLGEVCRAVELLEQGRTLIWTQMARFRTPLDSLQECGNHAGTLVKKFQELSSLLDKSPMELLEGTPRVKIEVEANRYARLVEEWDGALQDIRRLEGFSRFMLPPLFSDLQDAACDGPVIILIAGNSSCDAIIIPHQHSPIHVQLITTSEELEHLADTLQQTVKKDANPEETQTKLIWALRELWTGVVCPVVENLGRFALPRSRIWWCPTSFFSFLPLHAAGEYKQGGRNLSQLYVSSYTPSLTALIRARRRHEGSVPMHFAAIGQDLPKGASSPLLSVEPELELVRDLLPPTPTISFTKVTSIESTKSRALRTLRDNHWLHFACHGTQNLNEPFKSAFLMRDQPLSLLDIAQAGLSQHEFAFLSACETAVGNFDTPDEVIHLAAGLQFAGVKSVIGTFWSVDDSTVQRLVEAFYKRFWGDGKLDSKRAARALHRAVQSLANDKAIPLDQRIVFMHIGL